MVSPVGGCCDTSPATCVFDKALMAHHAVCECAQRRAVGERQLVECAVPVARINCATLAALLHERARFALRLPPPGRPVMHAQSLRLQCGGLLALHALMTQGGAETAAGCGDVAAGVVARPDVHRLVGEAQSRHGSLADLPWTPLVAAVARWLPQRRRTQQP